MKQRIDRAVEALRAQAVETLRAWIQIPSVEEAPEEGAPFGKPMVRMLERALADSQALGMDVRNFDQYIGDATWGQGERVLGILTHLDVVPAGDGWQTPPFGAHITEDRVYGRGTSDDKGPAVAALYAVKALMDAGVRLNGRVRILYGCDEESGWADIAHYRKVEKMPDFGFAPDAGYPVINTEKGIVQMRISGTRQADALLSFQAGERGNVIPGSARAQVRVENAQDLIRRVEAFGQAREWPFETALAGDVLTITAIGIPGHSAFPKGTRNGAGMLLNLLEELGIGGPWVARLSQAIGIQSDGSALGIACLDAVSGALTLNLGILEMDATHISAIVDIRYPVHASAEALAKTIGQRVEDLGGMVEILGGKGPLHVPAESEIVTKLCRVYQEITGQDAKPYAIGGGTYARSMENCVAFGALFPGREELAHQAGEYVLLEDFYENIRIFAHAIVALLGCEGA